MSKPDAPCVGIQAYLSPGQWYMWRFKREDQLTWLNAISIRAASGDSPLTRQSLVRTIRYRFLYCCPRCALVLHLKQERSVFRGPKNTLCHACLRAEGLADSQILPFRVNCITSTIQDQRDSRICGAWISGRTLAVSLTALCVV